jgi:transposase
MAFEGSDLAMSGLRKGSGNASPRRFRDRKAVARYAGLAGSPDESGRRAGASGVLRGPVMLASGVA